MENRTWGLKEARDHFSEVVERALTEGPQIVTRHGKPVAQVVPFRQNARVNHGKTPSLYELLRSCPYDFSEIIPRRDKSPGLEITFT